MTDVINNNYKNILSVIHKLSVFGAVIICNNFDMFYTFCINNSLSQVKSYKTTAVFSQLQYSDLVRHEDLKICLL